MLKVVLKCDSSHDCQIVNLVLAKSNILILKTKLSLCDLSTHITIVVSDYTVMNRILFEVNQKTDWDVQVVRVKQAKKKEYMGLKV